ncbi:DUF2326 domain-containing protein [Clostridium estertheticum]|uniref:DUF2326 domain-containing protein n=1 Tax=Clostridium estertheticum TaxID=238834 RepID=UPI001C7D04E8|nr:DUF2326 domain-containing protein [Clostridium estertheticum]MBX4265896.1 DUF2326 domain-containing protein [Clostridium estertheticum]WLC90177.1 DUF2326 domain-containing protein [Clostridium estertheticum]
MLIERLIVRKTKPTHEIIRNIPFNLKGLSLIVDNTEDLSKESGNNVGKTTALKIIDLCLGANSVKTIYYDDDTKSENTEIKKFLNSNKVEAELVLIYKNDSENVQKISIVRQLYNKGKRYINNKYYTKDDFWEELKVILFDLKEHYPTLRQLIPKFIRVNDATDESMIKYLPMASNDTYDSIYLFLFDIFDNKLVSKKDELSISLNECEKRFKFYEKDDNILSLDSLKQRELLVEGDLYSLINKRKHFDYMETYKEELHKNRETISNINDLEIQAQLIEFDINLINKTIEKLKNEKSNINTNQINHIYNESKAYLGEIKTTFDDVLKFHNSMIQNRINFIKTQLESKNSELELILKKRDIFLEEKKKITIDILDEGLLEELNVLNSKIEKLNIEKGEINQSIKILEGVEKEKKSLVKQLNNINKQMNPININEKIKIFNGYFSTYCESLYGEKYLFVYNNNWKQQKKFPVSLDFFKGNVGTGMKKGVIVAFDLAYMKYTEKMKIKAPRFVIHDKLENTHINQLRAIFELCKDINGQYIMPILRERVNKIDNELIEKAKVLELSSDNKFFKI